MKREVIDKIAALMASAFGLVAALAWNDTIKALFKAVFGKPDELGAMFMYAILVTIIAVFATMKIGELAEKVKGEEEAAKK